MKRESRLVPQALKESRTRLMPNTRTDVPGKLSQGFSKPRRSPRFCPQPKPRDKEVGPRKPFSRRGSRGLAPPGKIMDGLRNLLVGAQLIGLQLVLRPSNNRANRSNRDCRIRRRPHRLRAVGRTRNRSNISIQVPPRATTEAPCTTPLSHVCGQIINPFVHALLCRPPA